MPFDDWAFVVAGYGLTGLTLLGYVWHLRARASRARRRVDRIRSDDR